MSSADDAGARASWRAVGGAVVPTLAVLAGGILYAAEALRLSPMAVLKHVEAYLVLMGHGEAERDRRAGGV